MRRSILTLALLFAIALVPTPGRAEGPCSLGYSEATAIDDGDRWDYCFGIPEVNYNYTLENAYCWDLQGNVPPYTGAFAEGFNLGPGRIDCCAFWLTQLGDYSGEPGDCYVWDGGVTREPGSVIGAVMGVSFENIPVWPAIGRNNVSLTLDVDDEFTVGCWGRWEGQSCWWYFAADEDGEAGHPWTYIAPDIGYPSGWQHPAVVFGGTRSMGMGVYFTNEPTSVPDSQEDQGAPGTTWGSIKALFD